ncbi:MAG: hypothetical protein KatS3mg009_2950 [Acidimicrobiia bacterium]|nr:MAG: hypothetical protein KatS3mg009_2950 [Acidimicrobiia bacterium]
MRKAAAVAILVLGVLAPVAGAPAPAVAAPPRARRPRAPVAPGADRDVRTGALRVSAQPGGGVWQSAVVTNRSPVRFTVALSGGDGWVRPALDRVLVDPGASVTVDFTVAPPRDAPAGDHATRLVAEVPDAPGVRQELAILASVVGEPVPAPARRPAARRAGRDRRRPADGASDSYAVTVLAGTAVLVALASWCRP